MKEVGKRNVRSQGRADLFCVDTSQKQTILFRSPTKSEEYPNMRVVDFRMKEKKSISLGVYYRGHIKTH